MVWIAMKINWRIIYIREHFWSFIFWSIFLLVCLILLTLWIIAVLNYTAKAQEQWESTEDREIDEEEIDKEK